MPSLDIVIPVYGKPDLLEKCLESIPQGAGYGVITVDDASVDCDIKPISRRFGARYFKNDRNAGFPYTANRGVSKGLAPLVLLLNTDVVLEPGAIDVLVKEFANPKVGIAAPMLLFPEDSEWGSPGKIQHVGMAFDITGFPYHIFLGWSPSNPRAVQYRNTLNCVTGACFMFRRQIWNEIGGFDLVYGRGTFEDVEFCLKVRQKRHLIVVNPAARGTHRVAQSAKDSGGFPIKENFMMFRSRCSSIVRHDEYLFL